MVAKARTTMKGRFKPQFPEKYIGNPENIFFRSSWELRLFEYLDKKPGVLKWSSEEFSIPYLHPFDGKVRQYYPDVLVLYRDKFGNIKKEVVEVKPYNESVLRKNATDEEKKVYMINKAKWKAAALFCEKQKMEFRVITERTLFLTRGTKKNKK